MSKKILIDAVYSGETRVVIHDGSVVQDFDFENAHKKQLKGNIYLARVSRVEPSLQAAFIEYGGDKHGFLPFDEIHPSYFLEEEGNFSQESDGSQLADKLPLIVLPEVPEVDNFEEEGISDKNGSPQVVDTLNGGDNVLPNEEPKEIEDAEEDDIIDEDFKRINSIHQKYKIQDVIKKGQAILVQVIKEERGNKGAACTSYISLAGRYCVLMPNSDRQGGISRRIINPSDRKHLRKVLSTISLPEGVSVILRTAGAGKKAQEIRRDYFYLVRLWNSIREIAVSAPVNTFIHAESDLIKRTIRDLYSSEISEILIQGSDAYKMAKEFIKKILPLHVNKIKEYRSKVPIFSKFKVDEQISSLYNPVVPLSSGGYLVINQTEALIAIDVNSGKSTNEKNIEETALKTNLEAAVEVARQLRLRDLSGLIVVDFIDMLEVNNRKNVERAMRDAFATDRAKVQMSTISPFGLLELSRQRLQSSFTESNTIKCPGCNGKGHVKSFDSNAMMMLRTIENEIYKSDIEVLNVFAHPEVAMHLLNEKRLDLVRLEEDYKCKIIINKENTVYYDGYAIEKTNKSEKNLSKNEGPKLNDEEHFDSYGVEDIEEQVSLQEEQLGLGIHLSPYKVNEDIVMSQTSDGYIHNNRNNRFKKSSSNKGRRKISRGNSEESAGYSNSKPDLIFQQEDSRKPRGRNSRWKSRNRRPEQKKNEKKSTIKSWWQRLLD